MLRAGAVALGLIIALPGAAMACMACIAMPADSLADKAAAAQAVALLRPDPADPFRFVPVGYLKGGDVTAPVPFLVSRARMVELAADPDAAIVATWSLGTGWAIHDLGTPALAETLTDLLAADLTTPEARRDAFGPLVGHADAAVSRMAMIELATLPYAILRTTPARIDRADVARAVSDPLWSEWAPIAILLLGLSEEEADHAFIRRATRLAAATGRTAHLAAWATALVEVDGADALDWLRATYVDDPARSETEMEQIGLALASHAGREDATGAAIRDGMGALAASWPSVAAALASAMMDREDWSLAAEAERWLDDGRLTSPADAFLLTHYVLAAEAALSEPVP
jgi:hypothetical protein